MDPLESPARQMDTGVHNLSASAILKTVFLEYDFPIVYRMPDLYPSFLREDSFSGEPIFQFRRSQICTSAFQGKPDLHPCFSGIPSSKSSDVSTRHRVTAETRKERNTSAFTILYIQSIYELSQQSTGLPSLNSKNMHSTCYTRHDALVSSVIGVLHASVF
ncbi:hypothetical protein STEG23_021875 [Scotinomys teguina]